MKFGDPSKSYHVGSAEVAVSEIVPAVEPQHIAVWGRVQLKSGIWGNGIVWTAAADSCKVTQSGTPGQHCYITWGGNALIDDVVAYGASFTTISLAAADATNPRYDLVVLHKDGGYDAITGTPAAEPTVPAVPSHSVALAAIYRAANDNVVTDAEITDWRIKLQPWINENVGTVWPRPVVRFHKFPTDVCGEYAYTSTQHTGPALWTVNAGFSGYKQVATWVDNTKKARLAVRTLPYGEWSTSTDLMGITNTPFGTVQVDDGHNAYAVAVDTNQRIHVIGNMHAANMDDDANHDTFYAYGATGLSQNFTYGVVTGVADQLDYVTYPNVISDITGGLHLLHLDRGPSGFNGPAGQYLRKHNATTNTWALQSIPVSSADDNPYVWHPTVDRWAWSATSGRWHFFWTWRWEDNVLANHDFYHAYSDDQGVSFKEMSTASAFTLSIDSGGTMGRIINSNWRDFQDGAVTSGSITATSATGNFTTADVGRIIETPQVPPSTTIVSRVNATTITMSDPATASATGVHFIVSDNILNQGVSCVDTMGRPHALIYKGRAGANTTQVLHHVYWTGTAWVVTELPLSTVGAGRSAIFCDHSGRVWGLYQSDWYERRGFINLIDLTPYSSTYGKLSFPIAGPNLDLHSCEMAIDYEALHLMNELHIAVVPASDPGFSTFISVNNWTTQWGGVLAYDMERIESLASGEVRLPGIEIIGTVSKSGPDINVLQTTADEIGIGSFAVTTAYQAQSQLFVRLRGRGKVAVAGDVLNVRAQERPTGYSNVFRGRLVFTGTTAVDQNTPWLPMADLGVDKTGFIEPVAFVDAAGDIGIIEELTMDIGRWTHPREVRVP